LPFLASFKFYFLFKGALFWLKWFGVSSLKTAFSIFLLALISSNWISDISPSVDFAANFTVKKLSLSTQKLMVA